jgi:O-succinylbenzoic acid--CoA ligase
MDSIWINGHSYNLAYYIHDPTKTQYLDTFEEGIISFIIDWKSGRKTFELRTSGTTGESKAITIYRDQMIASAKMTLSYLHLRKGDKLLLCLNPSYVAGIMMIVRSLVGDLELYVLSPTANPLLNRKLNYNFHLSSFVPYQVNEILKHPRSLFNFKQIQNILIGGADIPDSLAQTLKAFENNIYQTFGMTETVSHVGLKRLSGQQASSFYEVPDGIEIDVDARGCLTVTGKITGGKTIVTNDLADLYEGKKFKWKGRIDQVINTGGIKIRINDLEDRIHSIFESADLTKSFFIAGFPDNKLGEKVILTIETQKEEIDEGNIRKILRSKLSRYEVPKEIYTYHKFPLTATGKIDKKAIIKQLKAQNK